jgi:hypothetical protein
MHSKLPARYVHNPHENRSPKTQWGHVMDRETAQQVLSEDFTDELYFNHNIFLYGISDPETTL